MNRLLCLILLFSSLAAHAHGEDKLGPNGGYVRMPGAFHTEVVQQGPSQIRVYLLDLHWKKPSVKASSVKVKLKSEKQIDATCTPDSTYYLCTFPKETELNHGQLIIESKRENQQGQPVIYSLPLRIEELG